MAIKGTKVHQGVTASNAYAYIDSIHGNKDSWCYHYALHFAPPTRDEDGKITDRGFLLDHRTFDTPRVDGEDAFVTCYEAMKKREEFAGFVDA